MAKRAAVPDAERAALARVEALDIDVGALSAISNVFRVANAFRNLAERRVLSRHGLSFSGFTVLWVLWVWGPREPGELAEEAGITKGTLTGVLKTLEGHGLTERRPHRTDGRRVVIRLTARGKATIHRLFPQFNALETAVTGELSEAETAALARALRTVLLATQAHDTRAERS